MNPITYTYEELVAHKESGRVPSRALERLRRDADAILEKPTLKVTDIKLPRPSGDMHDFVSMGPYWWPNPDTPDGLPYVSRDGEINPETQSGVDPVALYKNALTLALAALYFPERAAVYAEYFNRQLYDWYINPDTYMKPNVNFGQGIPGECEGRGAGLISFGSSYKLFNAIGIFANLGFVDEATLASVKAWHTEFTDWMLTHEFGLRIDNAMDNHASWRDANLLATAVFTERPALVNKIAKTAYLRRVSAYIKEDGSQPEELRRTLPIPYSFFNLEALTVIANIAERLGCGEYWDVDSKRGKCVLKSAVDLLEYYLKNPESFSAGAQKANLSANAGRLARALTSVAKRYADEGYAERALALGVKDAQWLLEPPL